MGFTNPPPIQADFLEFAHDRNGRIISAKVSRAWLRWFADFQEGVEVGLTLAQLQSELAAQSGSLAATLATNNVESIGAAATISINTQPNIDAIGASLYGNSYKGKWVAGVHAVNEYRSHSGRYYRCKVARSSSDTSDPSQDNTGWEAIGSSFSLEGGISTARQENIDAAARLVFGDDYKSKWAAGTFAVGDVAYDDVTQKFYECDAARTASNTDRPSVDSANWSLIPSLKSNVLGSTGLARVKSQVFTSSGTWPRPENVNFVKAFLVGSGGGGGGGGGSTSSHIGAGGYGGGGGAGGQLIIAEVPVSGDVLVTIGAGGLGGAGSVGGGSSSDSSRGSDGSAGGDTTFGSILRARGGQPGHGNSGYYRSRQGSVHTQADGAGGFGPDIENQSLIGTLNPAGGRGASASQVSSLIAFDGAYLAGLGRAGLAGTNQPGLIGRPGGGGGGSWGSGGDGGEPTTYQMSSHGNNGGSALANSGGGGSSGGSVHGNGSRNGGNGGNGGSGYAIFFWTE